MSQFTFRNLKTDKELEQMNKKRRKRNGQRKKRHQVHKGRLYRFCHLHDPSHHGYIANYRTEAILGIGECNE